MIFGKSHKGHTCKDYVWGIIGHGINGIHSRSLFGLFPRASEFRAYLDPPQRSSFVWLFNDVLVKILGAEPTKELLHVKVQVG